MFTSINTIVVLVRLEDDKWINPNKLTHMCKDEHGTKLFFDQGNEILSNKSCDQIVEILNNQAMKY